MLFNQRIPLAAVAVLCLEACAGPRTLAPAPFLYTENTPYPSSDVAPFDRTPSAQLIYYTDRAFDPEAGVFTGDRSAAVSIGEITVRVGETSDWSALAEASQQDGAQLEPLVLTLAAIEDRRVLPETPVPFAVVDGEIVEDAEAWASYDAAMDAFKQTIEARLAETGHETVLVYIHGFNNAFEDAAYALTDLWHYSGRSSVPVLFSWPSHSGGPLGYFGDRESGDFSIFHLKEMIRAITSIESATSFNIVAHSRGTDVTTTALRELVIETRAAGLSPQNVLRIRNLVLAAPDLDLEVVEQRLIAEQFGPAMGRITIYTNPDDAALGVSSFVTLGLRFGRVTSDDLNANTQSVFDGVGNVHFVSAESVSGLIGHNYFRTHPAILADISVLLLSDADPGSEERPLERISGNFFLARNDYRPIVKDIVQP